MQALEIKLKRILWTLRIAPVSRLSALRLSRLGLDGSRRRNDARRATRYDYVYELDRHVVPRRDDDPNAKVTLLQ